MQIAKAQDLAKAYATASGVDLPGYKKKYNTTCFYIRWFAFKKNNNNSGKSNSSSVIK